MQKARKRNIFELVQFLLILLLPFTLFANGQQDSASQEDKKVVVFIRTGPEAEGMRAVAESFTAKTGIEVEMMEVGRSGYFSTMTTQLVSGTSAFDLVATNSAYVAQFAASQSLEGLNSYLSAEDKSYDQKDILFTYGYQGDTYAIPFDVSTHFLYYRTDLIDTPPETWEEYFDLARKFSGSDSPTNYGTAITALPGPELPKAFYSLMWSMEGELFNNSGKANINSDQVIKAAEFYRAMAKEQVLSPDIISWGFPNVLDALKTGSVPMASPYWNAAYPQIVKSDSPYKDKIALALVPGVKQADGSIKRTPFQHGWSLAMNSSSKNKEAAWKFFAYATSKEGALIYANNGGTPARESVLKDPSLQPREYFDIMLESLSIAKAEPAVPYYLEMHEIMNQALSAVLTTGSDVKDIMDLANEQLEELINQ